MATKPEYVNAGYWWSEGSLPAENINIDLFTHLFAAFAELDGKTWKVIIPSPKLSTFSSIIKQKDPNVKTLLSIGGDAAKSEIFSNMVGDARRRKAFIDSSIKLARDNKYDGLDLYWLYPSTESDMQNLSLLLHEWNDALKRDAQETGYPQLLLVMTVYYSPYPNSLRYPIDAMKSYLDWINVVAYDFYTPLSSATQTGPTAVFTDSQSSCGTYGLGQWITKQNFPSKSIVLALPFYGWAWKLADYQKHDIFAPASGPATGQKGISDQGLGSYKNITNLIKNFSATEVYSEQYITSYCYYGNTWIGYDDKQCISNKVSKAKVDLQLLGYVAWEIGGDTADNLLASTARQTWKSKSS